MKNLGKLIVIDGVDASGKETQTDLIAEKLQKAGKKVRKISFPAYQNASSTLVKLYLSGAFGSNPEDVNAYAASSFFAADRYATFKQDWGKDYSDKDTIIIADRYVSSNMIHQAGKLQTEEEKEEFMAWLDDFEYNKYGLPRPDLIIFLDMPPECGKNLMKERANKINGGDIKDIHERNSEYMSSSYITAVNAAKKYGWTQIKCEKDGNVRTVDEINDEIFAIVKEVI